jgi:2'-5' RNA ligase
MAERIRAFIAIGLTYELKSILTQIRYELEARIPPRTLRWVKPAAMHLTLVFLGDTPVARLNSIEQSMAAAMVDIPPIAFTASGMGCYPNTRRPRVVWVGIHEPAGRLKRLKTALDRELEPLGFKPERRPFSPHLTLGRIHRRASREDARKLGEVVAGATLKDAGEMIASHIHLVRSDLRPSGPIYTVLARVPFAG